MDSMKKISCLLCFVFFGLIVSAQQSGVSWNIQPQKGANGEVELVFTAAIKSGLYMYSTNPGGGAVPVTLELQESNDYAPPDF